MICVTWIGMGSYVQCVVKQLVQDMDEKVVVVAITSDVPKICSEELDGARVIWVEKNDTRSIEEVVGEMPRVLVISGWYLPILQRYLKAVKRSGGKVIGTLDNPMMHGIRLGLWILYFNVKYRRFYDGFIVAGESTRKLLSVAGFPKSKISLGNYPCDLSLFTNGASLSKRERTIVYVGRFIDVKNIQTFLRAYIRFAQKIPGWNLDLYGQGPLQDQINAMIADSGLKTIAVHPFATPQFLSEVYKNVRVLVLPSWSDHWGVVVQEAAASGCAILASTGVRAADAFCNEKNSFIFDPASEDQMVDALTALSTWTEEQWDVAQAESVRLAQILTPKTFSDGVRRLIDAI